MADWTPKYEYYITSIDSGLVRGVESEDEFDELMSNPNYRAPTESELSVELKNEYYDDPLKAGIAGAARGASFGLSDLAAVEMGLASKEDLQGYKEGSPVTSFLSELGGGAATMFVPGAPANLLVRGSGKVGAAAAKPLMRANVFKAGGQFPSPVGAMFTSTPRSVATSAMLPTTASKVAGAVVDDALQGAVVGGAMTADDRYLRNEEQEFKELMKGLGLGAAGGVVAGGLLRAPGAYMKYRKAPQEKLNKLHSEIEYLGREATLDRQKADRIRQALDDMNAASQAKGGIPPEGGPRPSAEDYPNVNLEDDIFDATIPKDIGGAGKTGKTDINTNRPLAEDAPSKKLESYMSNEFKEMVYKTHMNAVDRNASTFRDIQKKMAQDDLAAGRITLDVARRRQMSADKMYKEAMDSSATGNREYVEGKYNYDWPNNKGEEDIIVNAENAVKRAQKNFQDAVKAHETADTVDSLINMRNADINLKENTKNLDTALNRSRAKFDLDGPTPIIKSTQQARNVDFREDVIANQLNHVLEGNSTLYKNRVELAREGVELGTLTRKEAEDQITAAENLFFSTRKEAEKSIRGVVEAHWPTFWDLAKKRPSQLNKQVRDIVDKELKKNSELKFLREGDEAYEAALERAKPIDDDTIGAIESASAKLQEARQHLEDLQTRAAEQKRLSELGPGEDVPKLPDESEADYLARKFPDDEDVVPTREHVNLKDDEFDASRGSEPPDDFQPGMDEDFRRGAWRDLNEDLGDDPYAYAEGKPSGTDDIPREAYENLYNSVDDMATRKEQIIAELQARITQAEKDVVDATTSSAGMWAGGVLGTVLSGPAGGFVGGLAGKFTSPYAAKLINKFIPASGKARDAVKYAARHIAKASKPEKPGLIGKAFGALENMPNTKLSPIAKMAGAKAALALSDIDTNFDVVLKKDGERVAKTLAKIDYDKVEAASVGDNKDPRTAQAIEKAKRDTWNYIISTNPYKMKGYAMPGELRKYIAGIRAIINPWQVLENISAGDFNATEWEALKVAYPMIHKAFIGELQTYVDFMKQENATIPRHMLRMLDRMGVDLPADKIRTLNKDRVYQIQGIYQEEKPGPQPSGEMTVSLETPAQSLGG